MEPTIDAEADVTPSLVELAHRCRVFRLTCRPFSRDTQGLNALRQSFVHRVQDAMAGQWSEQARQAAMEVVFSRKGKEEA